MKRSHLAKAKRVFFAADQARLVSIRLEAWVPYFGLLRDSQLNHNLISSGLTGSETGSLWAKPTVGLRWTIQAFVDHLFHGLSNAGGQADKPVRCSGSRLISRFFKW